MDSAGTVHSSRRDGADGKGFTAFNEGRVTDGSVTDGSGELPASSRQAQPTGKGRARRVIIVSLMKSGTHLLQELMVALGYGMYGHVRTSPEIRPVLGEEARRNVARMAYDADVLADLEAAGKERFADLADQAWEALAWSWQIRFGQPLVTWYTRELIDTGLVERVHRRTAGTDFSQTPPGVCWVFNRFDIRRIDGHFLHEWTETGEPRVIYNYRDPRDMTLSMVNFLSGRTGRGFSAYNDFPVFSNILKSKPTLDAQLTYALTDPCFPAQQDLHRMYWMLNHPAVCKTSFEDLVGPPGGGSAAVQAKTLERIFEFLGVTDSRPEDVADRLFNRSAFSFYRGQAGAWREVFTDEHRRLARDRFGEMMQLYGYDNE